MNTMSIVYAAILIFTIIFSIYWGIVLSVRLPEIDQCFDRKPFNCRPCLTFHLIFCLSILNGLITQSATLLAVGVVAAFIVFFAVRYIDNKKITK